MTYTLHTDSNILKRSQSPEGRNAKGLFSATAANSFSVPNMASMNVHAGGKVGVARSGSGCKLVSRVNVGVVPNMDSMNVHA